MPFYMTDDEWDVQPEDLMGLGSDTVDLTGQGTAPSRQPWDEQFPLGGDTTSTGYSVPQMSNPLGFLHQPLKGGNLLKTLALLGTAGMAEAHNPGSTAAAMGAYQKSRENAARQAQQAARLAFQNASLSQKAQRLKAAYEGTTAKLKAAKTGPELQQYMQAARTVMAAGGEHAPAVEKALVDFMDQINTFASLGFPALNAGAQPTQAPGVGALPQVEQPPADAPSAFTGAPVDLTGAGAPAPTAPTGAPEGNPFFSPWAMLGVPGPNPADVNRGKFGEQSLTNSNKLYDAVGSGITAAVDASKAPYVVDKARTDAAGSASQARTDESNALLAEHTREYKEKQVALDTAKKNFDTQTAKLNVALKQAEVRVKRLDELVKKASAPAEIAKARAQATSAQAQARAANTRAQEAQVSLGKAHADAQKAWTLADKARVDLLSAKRSYHEGGSAKGKGAKGTETERAVERARKSGVDLGTWKMYEALGIPAGKHATPSFNFYKEKGLFQPVIKDKQPTGDYTLDENNPWVDNFRDEMLRWENGKNRFTPDGKVVRNSGASPRMSAPMVKGGLPSTTLSEMLSAINDGSYTGDMNHLKGTGQFKQATAGQKAQLATALRKRKR